MSDPIQPCQASALHPTQAPTRGLWDLCQYSLKSWMAAFLMAQQGEPRPCSARAIMGVAWHSTAPPSPAPRTSVCSTWRAHTWGEHTGLSDTMSGEEGGKTQGSQEASAPRLLGWTAQPGLCGFAHSEFSCSHAGYLTQITLFPKGLQQPGVPHSPAGGRGSGPSPVAVPWQPRPAVSGCSGSGGAVPVLGAPR